MLTPCATRRPMAASLRTGPRSSAGIHTPLRPFTSTRPATMPELGAHVDEHLLDPADERHDVDRVGKPDDRVTDELAGAVPGDLPTSVDVDDGRSGVEQGTLVGLRPLACGVDRLVLEQQRPCRRSRRRRGPREAVAVRPTQPGTGPAPRGESAAERSPVHPTRGAVRAASGRRPNQRMPADRSVPAVDSVWSGTQRSAAFATMVRWTSPCTCRAMPWRGRSAATATHRYGSPARKPAGGGSR